MRWPIRLQIMLPMLLVMLVTLVGVSALNAYFSYQQAKDQIVGQLRDAVGVLADASFPLHDDVLEKMRGLSGAEYVLAAADGSVVASSAPQQSVVELPQPDQYR